MEPWRKVWRAGYAPELSLAALQCLRTGLESDDPALLQRQTTQPRIGFEVMDVAMEGADALCYGPWRANEVVTVADAERVWAALCRAADGRCGGPGACRGFLGWYDVTPRDVMRRELLSEVELAIQGRGDEPK